VYHSRHHLTTFDSMIRTAVDSLHEHYSHKRYQPFGDIICAPILLVIVLYIASIGPIATPIALLIGLPALICGARLYYNSTNRETNEILPLMEYLIVGYLNTCVRTGSGSVSRDTYRRKLCLNSVDRFVCDSGDVHQEEWVGTADADTELRPNDLQPLDSVGRQSQVLHGLRIESSVGLNSTHIWISTDINHDMSLAATVVDGSYSWRLFRCLLRWRH